jgi:hypothetical protein
MPSGWSWTTVAEVVVGVALAGLIIGFVARR